MKKFKDFLAQKGISESDFQNKSAEEVSKLNAEYQEWALKEVASKDDVKAVEDKLKDFPTQKDIKKQNDTLGDIQEQVNRIKEMSTVSLSSNEKTLLRKAVKEKHTEIVKAVKEKRPFELSFKAPAMHMTNNGTVSNGSVSLPVVENYEVDTEVAVIRRPKNFILDVISNRQVSKVPQTRIKTEQAPTEGAAALTAEGAVKPLIQYKFVRTSTDRVKYAGHIEWSEEFEYDFEYLYRQILRLFEKDVLKTWQDGVLTQIRANATSYVSTTLDSTLPSPDSGLAIVAGQAQLTGLNYMPDTAVINSADLFPVMFQQDENGNLKRSPYIDIVNGTINGMRLVVNNTIPAGKALVMDSSIYDEEHSEYIMRTGQMNGQLIENEYTAIGEVFSILSVAELDLVGVVELDLATVKTALQKPA